jgi:hypothetical protein
MNPLFRSAVGLTTLASFAAAADGGKTLKVPANVLGQLLTVQATGNPFSRWANDSDQHDLRPSA